MKTLLGARTTAGRGRSATVLVPATLGLALLTASAVPAAQTLLPRVTRQTPLPAIATAPDARIPLHENAFPAAPRTLRHPLPTVTTPAVTNAPTAPHEDSPRVTVTLATLAPPDTTTVVTPTATTVADYTRAKNTPLSANAVPEPATLALTLPALALLPLTRRRPC